MTARGAMLERRSGPGALLVAAALALALLPCASGCGEGAATAGPPGGAVKPRYSRGLIVLGIDGMDPSITRRLLAAGQMPNLAALLADGGQLSDFATTSPPQSPVAWSTFITGMTPAGTGIFDFIHRDPVHMAPYLSTSRTHEPDHSLTVGSFNLPLGSPDIELLRHGRAFWQVLEDHGVPATVVKIPANFPPAPSERAESMAGMGTPDLMGTYGTFQILTDDPAWKGKSLNGGVMHALDFHGGQRAQSSLAGPPSPLKASADAMSLPVELVRDRDRNVALVRLGDRDVLLKAGEWSDWEPVAFDPGLLAGDAVGMVRLYLRQVQPHFYLYVSPINLDPLDPAMPLSSPARYAADLARDVGENYSQGMPEDTKALDDGALRPPEFLAIVDRVMTETHDIIDRELDRFHGGFLFVYLSSIDQTSHVFYRSMEPDAPAADRVYRDVIPGLYRRVDQWIGEVHKRAVAKGARLVVMSDHGFAPYRTKVHLNTFLAQRGYLVTLPPDKRRAGSLGHIDWSRTQAYALGLNEVFINLRGREAHGVVAPADRAVLMQRLRRDLLSLRDPTTGATAITRIDEPDPGRFPERAPDIIVGYRRGYRSSDESALGGVGERVFETNTDQWSGDHCMDPTSVPGTLISSVPLAAMPGGRRPGLIDMAPSILGFFGIEPLPEMVGHSVWPAGGGDGDGAGAGGGAGTGANQPPARAK